MAEDLYREQGITFIPICCSIFGGLASSCPGAIPEIGLSTRLPHRPGRRADGGPPGQESLHHTPEGARLYAPQLRPWSTPLGGRWTTVDNIITPDQ